MRAAIIGAAILIQAAGVAPARAQTTPEGLRAGDMVRLKIWREPDLSGDFQVDERGPDHQASAPRVTPNKSSSPSSLPERSTR